MPENCLFCLEPIGSADLAVPNLPCMCRTPQHDACRVQWNRMNPYRCPICRKTFKPELAQAPRPTSYDLRTGPDMMFMVPVEDSSYQNQTVYVPMPSAPPVPAPQPQPQPVTQTQTQTNNNERTKKVFAICFTILICVFLFIIGKSIIS